MIVLIIVGSIYFILLDELVMGCGQRRIGPFNLGGYGFYTSIINGCNLIISQFLVPKVHLDIGFQSLPILFFIMSMQNYILIYPLFLVDIYFSLIILVWLMGLTIVFIVFSSFSSCGKYTMLGCIRIISQLISFELIWTTIILIYIWSWNELSLSSYWNLVLVDCSFSSIQSLIIPSSSQSVWIPLSSLYSYLSFNHIIPFNNISFSLSVSNYYYSFFAYKLRWALQT